MTPASFTPILDHLWQSTAFGGLMALAALALRKNRAAARFWLWLAASMKFLVPCALFMELGALVRRQPALATTASPLQRWSAIQDAGQAVFTPSAAIVTATTPAQSHADIWFAVIAAVWACGFLFVAIRWVRQWRAIRSLVRKAKPIDLGLPIATVSAPARLEPGVFGIFRPVLFLPEGISARLTREQMQALFAHELCHVGRRDNLWAAVHVLVEAVFWFHPLVWWLGARMIAEREAACDEAVLKSGAEAETYATSVLEVCRIYAASPMPAIAGITGADLKQRVITIASQSFGMRLSVGRKTALAGIALAALAAPVVFGLVRLPLVRALDKDEIARLPRFEVASVKPWVPNVRGPRGALGVGTFVYPGGSVVLNGLTVKGLLLQALNVQPFQISGGPDWATDQRSGSRFDIEAIPPDSSPSKKSNPPSPRFPMTDEQRQMLLALLIDRFQLQFHTVTKTGDVSFLVRGEGKLQLQPPADTTKPPSFGFSGAGKNISMPDFASRLPHFLYLQHPVIDETGLKGSYDFQFPDEFHGCESASDCNEEDTEIDYFREEVRKIGLDLKSEKGPVETIVIDHVEKPSPN